MTDAWAQRTVRSKRQIEKDAIIKRAKDGDPDALRICRDRFQISVMMIKGKVRNLREER